ncbi:hypothetical protein F4818DRAFT_395383 [Hypoxylon cercidicola]|nr:hypothetical protein F4818DRAFT_395383 [Hypoxylon cercidicola]
MGSGIDGIDWSLPVLDGAGDPFIFANNVHNGQLDASDMFPGCQPSSDFLFNLPPGSDMRPESDAGPSDRSYSPPTMPESFSQGPTPKTQGHSPPVDSATALKRQRNNVAARKYRQKRIDRISELEAELKDVKEERDDLRIRLARQEAEAAALRSMLQMNSGKSTRS